jgi:PDZ domain-containing protein
MIRNRAPGGPVDLTVERNGTVQTVRLVTENSGNKAVVGIQLGPPTYRFPFDVKINLSDVGGPSAGLMFALGIVDKLTPDNLTGGRFIAGTGEIQPNGAIAPIGGIQQKMAGARAAGATVFLSPSDNCANTAGAVPAGLRVVKVSTLADAISDLEALKAGKPVPSC